MDQDPLLQSHAVHLGLTMSDMLTLRSSLKMPGLARLVATVEPQILYFKVRSKSCGRELKIHNGALTLSLVQ
jgi:hypothetical protein